MAKLKAVETKGLLAVQDGLWNIAPKIEQLGVVDVAISGDEIKGKIIGAVNVRDLSLIDKSAWQIAVAELLLNQCAGDVDAACEWVQKARDRIAMGDVA